MNAINKNLFATGDLFKGIKDSLHREQKELFFHRESEDEVTNNYFNFIKFLFNNPSKI